ncbi:MAG: lysine--tRNA ligase [Bdellovibrionota bacterium]|nr:lysine--tRNA ligase [Pseudomonadota bacterium]MDY6090125.1 lysine--tRNA ligase [Bdellovibrionota bacterium]
MIDNIREEKIKKMNNFKEAGIETYPAGPFIKESTQSAIKKTVGEEVKIAGRIMLFREMGNITFLTIQDEQGRMQAVLSKKELENEEGYKFWIKNLDMGDFVGLEGPRFTTQKGEESVLVKKITLLTKSLLPLPDKHKALQDEDKRLRKRYLDIMFNKDVQDLVYKRDKYWNAIRTFLKERGFTEVYTPVLETTPGGADARPFVTHHNALDIPVYLRISMGELWQKRLMVAGFEKTFEIGRQFRNEGMDAEHLQDYSQVEFYWAYANYEMGMKLVEEMYKYIAKEVFGTLKFSIKGWDIDLGSEWKRYSYTETIEEMTGININTASLEDITKKLADLKVEYDRKGWNLTRAIDTLWKYCRKQIPGPGFLINEPVSISPLAKRMKNEPDLTERFHVLIGGSEIGNGYSELNDPMDQASRFEEQQALRDSGDEEAQMHDKDFVEALEYGMPPTCGFGTSERLLWFLLDKSARECQTFPLMKP